MRLVTFAGPPASGKTTVICKIIKCFQQEDISVGAVKFDCLQTEDDKIFGDMGIPSKKGLSAELCPDHYYITNIPDVYSWGKKNDLRYLFTESAGLCNRCSPYIKNILSVCIIDQLSGINSPQKIGPLLKLADMVLITKGDIVSQAEREVFYRRVQMSNPHGEIYFVNGLTGQGIFEICERIKALSTERVIEEQTLRFPMPMALCSYCLGETKIGEEYQIGNVKKIG
ncbi:Ni2+-binding GTPase involved in regulation of expression and maturation of urease and hydrogenase [Lachnospiraceae bacterium XPB1003]|nr:Ni2+-binding GTPase involved in regulation of expression and maturation of urease and hydrogenase [Lachnospiraceae bacterium XPB1003]